eukprot:COSAG01_NODE_8829_length_2646_cov_1.828818_1_plen_49_part_10
MTGDSELQRADRNDLASSLRRLGIADRNVRWEGLQEQQLQLRRQHHRHR